MALNVRPPIIGMGTVLQGLPKPPHCSGPVESPVPSWPIPLAPQQYPWPAAVSAHVLRYEALSESNRTSLATARGIRLPGLEPPLHEVSVGSNPCSLMP